MSQIAPILSPAPNRRPSSTGKWLLIALVPLALIYLSMLNRYWVPSGDGEVYTCIARSLVRGEGLMFNGSRAGIAPPGWPIVLSLAMRISPEFWFLKSVTIVSMVGAMALAFFILRRFVTDRASAGVILLTGILSSIYPLTYWMHTEAFFCLISFAALLLAFRIAEGKAKLAWEVPLMLALLAFGSFTRWPGVLHVVLVVPILLGGPNQPWKRFSIWVITLLAVASCIGTFLATHSFLTLTKEEKRLAIASGGTAESEGETETPTGTEIELTDPEIEPPTTGPTTGPTTLPSGDDSYAPTTENLRGDKKRSLPEEIGYRIATSGKWFSWLLWQPTRFGQSVSFINASALIAGWLAIVMLLLTLIREVMRHHYFWIGLAAYTGGLCVLWPNPNARYFVPVAPFIVLGIFLGIQVVSEWTRRKQRGRGFAVNADKPATTIPASDVIPSTDAFPADDNQPASIHVRSLSLPAKVLMIAFVGATLLSNVPLLMIDLWVFRSSDFYGRYEAGSNKELMLAAQHINMYPRGGRVAVCELYDNMGNKRYSKFGQRALHLLTDQQVITPPRKKEMMDRPTQRPVRVWAKKIGNDVEYYVYQSAWDPWRVWHFRMSPELQSSLSGRRVRTGEYGGWELFVRRNANYPRLNLPKKLEHVPTRVPGL